MPLIVAYEPVILNELSVKVGTVEFVSDGLNSSALEFPPVGCLLSIRFPPAAATTSLSFTLSGSSAFTSIASILSERVYVSFISPSKELSFMTYSSCPFTYLAVILLISSSHFPSFIPRNI